MPYFGFLGVIVPRAFSCPVIVTCALVIGDISTKIPGTIFEDLAYSVWKMFVMRLNFD